MAVVWGQGHASNKILRCYFLKTGTKHLKEREVTQIVGKRDRILVYRVERRRVGREIAMVPRCSCNIKIQEVRLVHVPRTWSRDGRCLLSLFAVSLILFSQSCSLRHVAD